MSSCNIMWLGKLIYGNDSSHASLKQCARLPVSSALSDQDQILITCFQRPHRLAERSYYMIRKYILNSWILNNWWPDFCKAWHLLLWIKIGKMINWDLCLRRNKARIYHNLAMVNLAIYHCSSAICLVELLVRKCLEGSLTSLQCGMKDKSKWKQNYGTEIKPADKKKEGRILKGQRKVVMGKRA